MMHFPKQIFPLGLGLACLCSAAFGEAAGPSSTVPSDSNYREHYEWCKGAEDRLAAMQGKTCDLIFIGDSITGMWDSAGLKVWEKYYANRKALNFGAGGDKTQNALWRLETWKVSEFKPKVVVLLIGTNNIDDSQADMLAGIKAVLGKVRSLYPGAQVLLTSLLPRADQPTHAAKVAEVNVELRKLANGKQVHFVDLAPKFVAQADTYLGLGPDKLHLAHEGYEMWAEALEPHLRKYLGP